MEPHEPLCVCGGLWCSMPLACGLFLHRMTLEPQGFFGAAFTFPETKLAAPGSEEVKLNYNGKIGRRYWSIWLYNHILRNILEHTDLRGETKQEKEYCSNRVIYTMEGLYIVSFKKYTDVQKQCDIFGIFGNPVVFRMIPKVLHFFSVSDESTSVKTQSTANLALLLGHHDQSMPQSCI